jgi:hypothetical protein
MHIDKLEQLEGLLLYLSTETKNMQYIRSQLQAHVFVSHVIGSWLSNFDLKEKIYHGWGSRIMLGNLQIYIFYVGYF